MHNEAASEMQQAYCENWKIPMLRHAFKRPRNLKTLRLLQTQCNSCKSCCTALYLEEKKKTQRGLFFKRTLGQITNSYQKSLIRGMSREAMLFQVTREVTC